MSRQLSRFIHMGRIVPEIDPILGQQVENKAINPKMLPGSRKSSLIRLPAQLEYAAEKKIKTIANKEFRKNAFDLQSIMYNLKLPDNEHSLKLKKKDILTELEVRDKIKRRPEFDPNEEQIVEELDLARDELNRLIQGKLDSQTRDWRYYEYDEYASILYMAVRLPANYACIKNVFNEVKVADPSFEPKSVLDFGSGMGTTVWAVNETWPKSVGEYLNVDISKEQQTLCEYLMRGAKYSGDQLSDVFHRQYLPTSTKTKYDLVVAAFSLLELPNAELRAHTVENLWQKTNDMLVIIERGNIGGFTAINEARHLVLDLDDRAVTKKINVTYDTRVKPSLKETKAHIVAPCSHEFLCPRVSMPSKNQINTCKFKVSFEQLNIGTKRNTTNVEQFSYVVLRKGHNKLPYYHLPEHKDIKWPRIISKRKRSSGQVTFDLCTPDGNLATTTITRKYGKPVYEVAKACDWGSVLPIRIK